MATGAVAVFASSNGDDDAPSKMFASYETIIELGHRQLRDQLARAFVRPIWPVTSVAFICQLEL